MAKAEGVVITQIRIPVDVHKKLKEKAYKTGQSLNKAMVEVLGAGIEKEASA